MNLPQNSVMIIKVSLKDNADLHDDWSAVATVAGSHSGIGNTCACIKIISSQRRYDWDAKYGHHNFYFMKLGEQVS